MRWSNQLGAVSKSIKPVVFRIFINIYCILKYNFLHIVVFFHKSITSIYTFDTHLYITIMAIWYSIVEIFEGLSLLNPSNIHVCVLMYLHKKSMILAENLKNAS